MARAARTRLEAITGAHDERHGRALQDETTENAEAAAHMAISLIEQCSKVPKARHKALVQWCKRIPGVLEELKQVQDAEHGSQASVSDPP